MAEKVFTRGDMRRALSAAIFALDGGVTVVDGHDATFWRDSYRLLADAVEQHLKHFVREDDVAEEAIYVAAIEAAGASIRVWDCRVCGFGVVEGPALERLRKDGYHRNALGNDSPNNGTAYCPDCDDETLRPPSSVPAAPSSERVGDTER